MARLRSLVAVLAVFGVEIGGVGAAPSLFDVTAPGGFVAAVAGQGNGNGYNAGSNIEGIVQAGKYNVDWDFFANGSASTSVSFSNAVVNSAVGSGSAGFGYALFSGSSAGTNSSGHVGAVTGGWTDTLLVQSPGLSGQNGTVTYTLQVQGSLEATGFAGAGAFQLISYKNNAQGAGKTWAASSAPDVSANVNETVTLTIPVTFGTAFNFGIYAAAIGGFRSISGVGGISTSNADFDGGGMRWTGITQVTNGSGTPVAFTVSSASGTNWAGGVAGPGLLPGDANLNGVIDRDDFSLTDRGFAMGLSGWTNGDFNGDGSVGPADYIILNQAFGSGGGGAMGTIPEPGSLAVIAVAAAMVRVTSGRGVRACRCRRRIG